MRRLVPYTLAATLLLVGACSSSSDQPSTVAGSGGTTMGAPSNSAPAASGARQPLSPLDQAKAELANVGDRVFFATDSYTLNAEAKSILSKQAALLSRYPQIRLVIEGHADERGTREYNLALGDRRAQSVKNLLADSGVNPARLRTISYGKERPVAIGSDESAWSQNRRGVSTIE